MTGRCGWRIRRLPAGGSATPSISSNDGAIATLLTGIVLLGTAILLSTTDGIISGLSVREGRDFEVSRAAHELLSLMIENFGRRLFPHSGSLLVTQPAGRRRARAGGALPSRWTRCLPFACPVDRTIVTDAVYNGTTPTPRDRLPSRSEWISTLDKPKGEYRGIPAHIRGNIFSDFRRLNEVMTAREALRRTPPRPQNH